MSLLCLLFSNLYQSQGSEMSPCGWNSGPFLRRNWRQLITKFKNSFRQDILFHLHPLGILLFLLLRKKSGKWRLLQDLRKINKTMMSMGPTQPGLPYPVAIPKDWHLLVIDLKDCFLQSHCIPRIVSVLLLVFPLLISESLHITTIG